MFKFPKQQDLKQFDRILIYPKADPTHYITLDGTVETAGLEGRELYFKTSLQYASFDVADVYAVHFGNS